MYTQSWPISKPGLIEIMALFQTRLKLNSNQAIVNFIVYKCRVIAYFDDGILDKHTHNVRRNLL